MIWRSRDDSPQALFCDVGQFAGLYRAAGYVYGSKAEIDALVNEPESVSLVVASPDGGWVSGAMSNPGTGNADDDPTETGLDP